MVKVTNITDRVLTRRHPSGTILKWAPRQAKDITSSRLLEELSRQECFVIGKEVGTNDVGGGLKTGVRSPKRRGRPPKSKAKPKKEVKKEAKPKKGLKKSKKGKAD